MFLEPLVIFLLVRYMRKLLGTFTSMTELNKALTILLYAVPALFVIQQVLSSGHVTVWIWHLLLVAIIAAAFKLPEFTPVRPILIALLPLISLTIITDLLKAINYNLYLKAKTYFGIAFPIAITWMIAM